MNRLKLTDQLDAGLIFDTLAKRYPPEKWQAVLQGQDHAQARCAFIDYCRNYPSVGFEYDGRPIGGMMFDGREAHLEVLPEYHGRWALLWPRTLAWLFAIQDPILVRIEIDNEKCLRFMDRNNWRRVSVDDEYVTYQMTSAGSAHLQRRARGKRTQRAAEPPFDTETKK